MATDATALLAAAAAAANPAVAAAAAPGVTTETPAPAANPNVLEFLIPNTETKIGVDLTTIPAETRMELLKKAVQGHIVNRVNQVNVRHTKALAPFIAYEEAVKADPLQTAVPKPEGERPTVDLLAPAAAARKDLYDGKLRVQSADGTGKSREPKDPLIATVTNIVIRELHEKNKATKGWKYTDAVKMVGGDGVKYLNEKIAEKVAAGADAAVLNKFLEDRYMKPARVMLGIDTTKATKDQSIL